MGEKVWGYTVKGFEMAAFRTELPPYHDELPPIRAEMPPFQLLSPAGDVSFHPKPTFLSPKEGMVAPLEAMDWRKARPIRRPRASSFALFGCFRMPEVLLFALFQGKRFLEHDL